MGNSFTSNESKRESLSPYSDDFGPFARRKSKRWSFKKNKSGYFKTVSELDVERGLPAHLHYQSPNSIEEDLFSIDSRSPCVIQLHQRTRQDLNHLLRGSDAYSKVSRPKSFDPRMLLDSSYPYNDDVCSPQSPRNSSFMSSSAHINTKIRPDLKPSNESSEQTMKIDPSSGQGDIIKVDTSGAKFDRQANLRRSQRLTSSVRQRANAAQRRQQRHKHRTLIGLPGNTTAEISETPHRPYSVYSPPTRFANEQKSYSNGQVLVSPRQNFRNAEIQTDDVRVIPLTPAQKRMRQKIFSSNNSSPTSSHGSTEFLESPAPVPCPSVPMMKQTSTPINGVFVEKDLIRPSSLDVKNNDTSTDEGRHTGESNPPTPVRTGTPQELMASPELKKSQDAEKNQVTSESKHEDRPDGIALRLNGGKLNQNEDRASSGCWSGTESAPHSSNSDITIQHAPVMNALQQVLQKDRLSPKYANSTGQVSPIVDDKPLVSSSAVSSSTVSINSKLSTLDAEASNSSSYTNEDDRFLSASSSVISVTINRSHHSSNMSVNSLDSGHAISAAAMVQKTRKSRLNATGGMYNFMNYESDPLEHETVESRAIKSRRSTRSGKRPVKKIVGEDTISLSSMVDSSPRNTEGDAISVQSFGKNTPDTASLCESVVSADHDVSSARGDGLKTSPLAVASVSSMTESVGKKSPVRSPQEETVHSHSGMYNSYHRAVKSNHSTPKSLLTPRQGSASVKVPKHVTPPVVDFQSELNKRLSVRRVSEKKGKRAPPPPPRRGSSLSNSACPSPALSMRSEKISISTASTPSPKHSGSEELPEFYRVTPPPMTPVATPSPSRKVASQTLPMTPSITPSPSRKVVPQISPVTPTITPAPLRKVEAQNSVKTPSEPQSKSKASVSKVSSQKQKSQSTPVTKKKSPPKSLNVPPATVSPKMNEFYQNTPPPPPPVDLLPPPPPELLTPCDDDAPPVDMPVFSPLINAATPKSVPRSPTSPTGFGNSPQMQSIAMQAAMLGNRMSQKKKVSPDSVKNEGTTNESKTEFPFKKSPVSEVQPQNPPVTPSSSISRPVNSVELKSRIALEIQHQAAHLKHHPKTTEASPTFTSSPEKAKSKPETKLPPTETAPPIKQPPAVAAKPISLTKNKFPPPISAKPERKEDFGSKRTREQSPSYRASLARAAFFASASSKQESDIKPKKVALVASASHESDENIKTLNDTAENVIDEQITAKAITPASEPKATEPPNQSKSEESEPPAKNEPKSEEVKPSHEENEDSHDDTNQWMAELDGLSESPKNPQDDTTSVKLRFPNSRTPSKYPTHDMLMAAIHKSRRESLNGKANGASPPSSPGVNGESFSYRANGNKSPGSTLDRKRNGRISANGRNSISRKSTGGTSTDDFKALLLQNACKGNSGSQMSAAEKLLRNKPTSTTSALSRLRPASMNDAEKVEPKNVTDDNGETEDNNRHVLSLNDIRSAITSGSATTSRVGRTNRRGPRANGTEPKYQTLQFHGKKHPPPSLSSKYNTRSRTPTRPMMSISEDSETEKSPEAKPIKSVVDEST